MDFLEQLKKETEEKNVRDKIGQEAIDRRAELFNQEATAAMQGCYKYLRKLTDTLKDTNFSVEVEYDLEDVGKLTALKQSNYMILADNPDELNQFALQYECSGSQQIAFSRLTKLKIDQQKEILWHHGLRFDYKERTAGKEPKGDFFLEPWVSVKIEFIVDKKAQKLRLILKNLHNFEETTHILNPNQLNHDLLEQLARVVTRKPNQLDKLLGRSVTDTLRMRLQQTLIDAAKKKGMDQTPTEQTAKKKGMLGKLKTLFKKD